MFLLSFISFIYLFIYKKFKYFLRAITGKHEIEYYLKQENLKKIILTMKNSSYLTINEKSLLENIIKFDLKSIMKLNLSLFKHDFMKIPNDFCMRKGIGKDGFTLLSNAFMKMLNIFLYKINLYENKISVSFNDNDECHIDKLMKLWENTYKKYPIETIYHQNDATTDSTSNTHVSLSKSQITISNQNIDSISFNDKKWQWIGFQGTQPETDFRSTGLFGLDQLLRFTCKSKYFEEVYRTACSKEMWYFYASAGINISGMICKYLLFNQNDSKKSFENIWTYICIHKNKDSDDNESILIRIDDYISIIYEEVFNKFNSYWKSLHIHYFMMFNKEFSDFWNRNIDKIIFEVLDKDKKRKFY